MNQEPKKQDGVAVGAIVIIVIAILALITGMGTTLQDRPRATAFSAP